VNKPFSVTKINRLMLFRKTVTLYCEKQTLCVQLHTFFMLQTVGHVDTTVIYSLNCNGQHTVRKSHQFPIQWEAATVQAALCTAPGSHHYAPRCCIHSHSLIYCSHHYAPRCCIHSRSLIYCSPHYAPRCCIHSRSLIYCSHHYAPRCCIHSHSLIYCSPHYAPRCCIHSHSLIYCSHRYAPRCCIHSRSLIYCRLVTLIGELV
jgi:hypothetical protein